MRLVGSVEMRAIDRAAIEEFGIPALTLMDRAGRAVADAAAATTAATGTWPRDCCAPPAATRG